MAKISYREKRSSDLSFACSLPHVKAELTTKAGLPGFLNNLAKPSRENKGNKEQTQRKTMSKHKGNKEQTQRKTMSIDKCLPKFIHAIWQP